MALPNVGFVYILTNLSFPDQVKIGFTSRIVEDRVRELATAVPTDFEVAYRAATMNPREVERQTHELLGDLRVDSGKEFFRVSVEEARDVVGEAAEAVNGLLVWTEAMLAQKHAHYLNARARVVLPLQAGQWFAWIRYPDLGSLAARRPAVMEHWQVHSNGDALEIIGSKRPEDIAGFSDHDPEGHFDTIPHLDREGAVPNGHLIGRERLLPGDRLLWMKNFEGTDHCLSALLEARDYCQVVCRTWAPKLSPEGDPLILGRTITEMPKAMDALIRVAERSRAPRVWAPPDESAAGGLGFGTRSLAPDHWLEEPLGRNEHRKPEGRSG